MTDEERQRTMDFILQQQAKFAADTERLKEEDARAHRRIDRLERVLKLAIRAGRRERKEFRERYAALVDAQMRNEEIARRNAEKADERATRDEETSRRNSEKSEERFTRLEEAAQRATEAAARANETTDRASEDVSRLARIVEQLARQRNGGGADVTGKE